MEQLHHSKRMQQAQQYTHIMDHSGMMIGLHMITQII